MGMEKMFQKMKQDNEQRKQDILQRKKVLLDALKLAPDTLKQVMEDKSKDGCPVNYNYGKVVEGWNVKYEKLKEGEKFIFRTDPTEPTPYQISFQIDQKGKLSTYEERAIDSKTQKPYVALTEFHPSGRISNTSFMYCPVEGITLCEGIFHQDKEANEVYAVFYHTPQSMVQLNKNSIKRYDWNKTTHQYQPQGSESLTKEIADEDLENIKNELLQRSKDWMVEKPNAQTAVKPATTANQTAKTAATTNQETGISLWDSCAMEAANKAESYGEEAIAKSKKFITKEWCDKVKDSMKHPTNIKNMDIENKKWMIYASAGQEKVINCWRDNTPGKCKYECNIYLYGQAMDEHYTLEFEDLDKMNDISSFKYERLKKDPTSKGNKVVESSWGVKFGEEVVEKTDEGTKRNTLISQVEEYNREDGIHKKAFFTKEGCTEVRHWVEEPGKMDVVACIKEDGVEWHQMDQSGDFHPVNGSCPWNMESIKKVDEHLQKLKGNADALEQKDTGNGNLGESVRSLIAADGSPSELEKKGISSQNKLPIVPGTEETKMDFLQKLPAVSRNPHKQAQKKSVSQKTEVPKTNKEASQTNMHPNSLNTVTYKSQPPLGTAAQVSHMAKTTVHYKTLPLPNLGQSITWPVCRLEQKVRPAQYIREVSSPQIDKTQSRPEIIRQVVLSTLQSSIVLPVQYKTAVLPVQYRQPYPQMQYQQPYPQTQYQQPYPQNLTYGPKRY